MRFSPKNSGRREKQVSPCTRTVSPHGPRRPTDREPDSGFPAVYRRLLPKKTQESHFTPELESFSQGFIAFPPRLGPKAGRQREDNRDRFCRLRHHLWGPPEAFVGVLNEIECRNWKPLPKELTISVLTCFACFTYLFDESERPPRAPSNR